LHPIQVPYLLGECTQVTWWLEELTQEATASPRGTHRTHSWSMTRVLPSISMSGSLWWEGNHCRATWKTRALVPCRWRKRQGVVTLCRPPPELCQSFAVWVLCSSHSHLSLFLLFVWCLGLMP